MERHTTTDHFQKLPTFYREHEECREKTERRPQTNPRYPNFNQFAFTAGDVDQFEMYRDPTNGLNEYVEVDSTNIWNNHTCENVDWQKYRNLSSESVDSTFRYIFDKFKKGLFIKIKNNKLAVFLPFSKHNYVNEWAGYMKQPPEFATMHEFLQYATKLHFDQQKKPVPRVHSIPPPSTWYANNCLIRWDGGENDRGMSNLKDMFITLCESRPVPDIELFINKRDFPVINKFNNEPYEHLYGYENMTLLSHNEPSYCPILSNVTTNLHADIPMPTAEDWARVSSQEDGKIFAPDCRTYRFSFDTPWNMRKPTAVFRGGSTGCGTTVETNPRLRLAAMSASPENVVENGYRLLNAGIMKWNVRPRKHISSPYLQLIDPSMFPTVEPMSPEEQSTYKYIVNVDGHVSAFRLSLELSMGSVVLLVESKYRMWFHKKLVAYEHYVPIKEDLSDLWDQIRWCRANDRTCEQISRQAKTFYETYLTKKGVLDYLQTLLVHIKNVTGTYLYNSVTPADMYYQHQVNRLNELKKDATIPLKEARLLSVTKTRNYYAMEGLQRVLHSLNGLDEYCKRSPGDNIGGNVTHTITVGEYPLLLKRTSQRQKECVNEAFCGITEINSLLRDIPNVRYTYYADVADDQVIVLSEYIEGITFKEFIQKGCSMSEFLSVLVMLNMALAVAQEKIGFVHYDLVPWNIIIMTYDRPQKITYHFHNYVFTVSTRYIPVMIDYGRSHVISDGLHYGYIDPFKMTRMQDCFTLLVSSVYEMASSIRARNRFIGPNESGVLLTLINFLTGSRFHREKITSVQEMTNFLEVHKKYNELIYGDKCDLEQYKTPIDFIEYVMNEDRLVFDAITCEQIILSPPTASSPKIDAPVIHQSQFYEDLIRGVSPRASILSYINELSTNGVQALTSLHDTQNEMILCYTMSMFMLCIDGISSFVDEFAPELKKEIEMLPALKTNISESLNAPKLIFHVPYFPVNNQMILAKYTTKSFSNPSQMLSLLQAFLPTRKRDELLTFRNMFVFTSFYHVTYPLSSVFFHEHKRILELERLSILNHNASINTLILMCREIYQRDEEELRKMKHIPQKIFQTIRDIMSLI